MILAAILTAALGGVELPEEIRRMAEGARGAPAELGADILIRLAESPMVRERVAKRGLLEEAFELAAGARYQLTLSSVRDDRDSWEHHVSEALGLGLSRTALRGRVVRRMLAVDAATAMKLFERMEMPAPGPMRCTDTLAPQVTEYYFALKELLRRGFTEGERRRGLDFGLVSERVRRMRSPFDLEPMAEIIRDGNWTKEQLQDLANGYGLALGVMQADGRSFQRAANFGLQQRVFELARRFVKNGVAPLGLIGGWRQFLVRHGGGVRCGSGGVVEQLAKGFNEGLRELGGVREFLPVIGAEEMSGAKAEEYGKHRDAGAFHRRCVELRELGDWAGLAAVLRESKVRVTSPAEWYLRVRDWQKGGGTAPGDGLMDVYLELERVVRPR